MKALLTRWGIVLHGSPVEQADLDDLESKLFFDRESGRDAYVRFAVLLVLSVVIATGGVLSDSTATVIGAMIVAPLMTPIMATALAMVTGDQHHIGRSLLLVGIGVATAIGLSALFAWLAPGILALVVIVMPLALTSWRLAQNAILESTARAETRSWLSGSDDEVASVDADDQTLTITIDGSGAVPSPEHRAAEIGRLHPGLRLAIRAVAARRFSVIASPAP